MADEDGDEDPSQMATLELTILSAQDLKDTTFLGKKMKSFVVAWVDPRLKKSTKTLTSKNPSWNSKLSFPLLPQTLQNPTSILTLQILSSHSRVVGSAILAISSIRPDIHTFTLQLWRPSGCAQGLLTVSARMSSFNPRAFAFHGCVTGIPVASDPTASALFPDRDVLGESGCYNQRSGRGGCSGGICGCLMGLGSWNLVSVLEMDRQLDDLEHAVFLSQQLMVSSKP
ncbi:hypothetical protein AAC387_Pa02g3621 [Persea americana]